MPKEALMFRLALVPLVVLVALGAAAGGARSDGGGPSPGAVQGWDGVLAPSGQIRYVALWAGRQTVVAAVRVHGGRVVRSTAVRGTYGIPAVANDGKTGGLSADGKTLVLATYATIPGPKAVTRFAVLRTRTFRLQQIVTLRGSYSYDAISPDGSAMFLIEYLSLNTASRQAHYRVRAFDLVAGKLLEGAITDRRERSEDMAGQPVTRAMSRDSTWAYTLYSKYVANGFVHALDTRHRAAVCIDLPWNVPGNVRMTLSADGRQLVLRQPAIGRLAVIDTKTFRVQALKKPVAPGSPVQ